MEEWLRKLLQAASVTPYQGTVGQTSDPSGIVPPSRLYTPHTGSFSNSMSHPKQVPAPLIDPQATRPRVVPGMQIPTAPQGMPSQEEQLNDMMAERSRILATTPDKQNKWLNGLFLGLQGLQRVADPERAPNGPIVSLGEARKMDKVGRLNTQIQGVQGQIDNKRKSYEAGLDLRKKEADIANTESITRQREYERSNPGTETQVIDGVLYERPKGSKQAWRKAEGIEPKKMAKVKVGDKEYEVPTIDAVRLETERFKTESERLYQTGKINSDRMESHRKEVDDWQAKEIARGQQVDKWVSDGVAAFNQAGKLRAQAAKIAGTKEALDLETKADELEAESSKLLNYAVRSKPTPKPTTPSEFTPSTGSLPAGVSKDALVKRLRERGIKEGSSQWNTVMRKAGF